MARTHTNPWGVIFRALGRTPASDTAFEIKNLAQGILYDGQSTWLRQSFAERPDGLLYNASFVFPQETAAPTLYSLPPRPIITDVPTPGWAYHFFNGRLPITATILGMYVCFEARLVSKTGGVVPDSEVGVYLAQTGADYKASDGSDIVDSWAGSLRVVSKDWRKFYGTSIGLPALQANPPPASLQQVA